MRRARLLPGAALAVGLAVPAAASAQEIQLTGPLKGTCAIGYVTLDRESRWRAVPGVAVDTRDASALFATGELLYHPDNAFGVGVWGARAATASAAPPWLVVPEVALVPVRGKVDLFGWFSRFDVALHVGAVASDGPQHGALMVGVGTNLALTSWLTLGLEYRALPRAQAPDLAGVTLAFSLPTEPHHRDESRCD